MTTQTSSTSENRSSGPPAATVELLTAAANRLKEELDDATDDTAKAVLLHEIAALLERAGDDPGAARDFLSAFNAEPDFREPLESLVALLHRRRSVKNLGKLLEALVRAATTPEEIARALFERAAFLLEQQGDPVAAKSALREAVAENADEVSAWLELEVLAGKESDTAGRIEALEERAKRAEPAAWRALLLLDVADVQAQAGDVDKAAETCRAAAALDGATRFRAYVVLAELSRKEKNEALLAEALEAQAALAQEAIANTERGDALGVPRYVRTPGFVADAWLRAAESRRRSGDSAGASALLDGAAQQLPNDTAIISAQIGAADASGDSEKSSALARKLLEAGATGPEAASLWMRVEEDAAGRGDLEAAIDALAKSLAADPGCIPARALQLDFLSMQEGEKEGTMLAASLEAAAEQLHSDTAKARSYLRAAWEWATFAKDTAGAKAALSQAGALGIPAVTLSRIARTLAALVGDTAWYDESTRRLVQARASEGETTGLWFELVRGRLLRGEIDAAQKGLDSLAAAPQGAWLSRVTSAYALSVPRDGKPATPSTAATLDALSKAERDPDMARAIQLAAAWRASRSGDEAGAKTRLTELLSSDAGDALSATFLSELFLREKDATSAASILTATAAATEDRALSAAMSIEAGLRLWGAGKRAEALEPFRAARGTAPEAAGSVLSWATRAVSPDTAASRREALELAEEGGDNPALLALERFGLEVSADGEENDARAALETLDRTAHGELALAAALARLAWAPVAEDRAALEDALSKIEGISLGASAIARAERARLSRDDQNAVEYAKHSASWASADPSLAPALEWLAASAAMEDRDGESAAHRLIASHLEGEARAAENAAATIIQWITVGGATPNLLGGDAQSTQLLNLELAPPGSDPRRRSAALKGVSSALGEEAAADARALAAWSDLVNGDATSALEAFRAAVEAHPDDIASWEGIRVAATDLSDVATTAYASAKLGELGKDDARAAEHWEQAGILWIDAVDDPEQGEAALYNAFSRDRSRLVAFDKLFRRVRERQDDDALLELIGARLEVADDSTEIAKLYWEQARALRKKGDQDGAMDALTNVTLLEPDHVGALALTGEIFIKKGMFEDAATSLGRLAALPDAPAQQRLISGVAAADLYEKRLNNIEKALESLSALHAAGLSTLAVRERLAALATKSGAWSTATTALELLIDERDTPENRIQAARLAMAIWRDKVGEPKKALRAVTKLLKEAPSDGEAIDLVLVTDFEEPHKGDLLALGKNAVVNALQRRALEPDMVARLAKIARESQDAPLLQATLGVLVALGRDEPGIAEELASLDARVAKVPQIQLDQRVLLAIGDTADGGPLVKLFEVLGETIGEALGPSKEALGVGRKERVDPRSGVALRNDVAAWAGALGLGEFELYVGGKDPNGVQGVAGEVPALVVGPSITSPLSAAARQAIARELFALRRGITVVRSRDEATVASIAIAACNLAEVKIDAPPFAILGDVQRQLGKALSRKVKKELPPICQEIAAARSDVRNWAGAVQRSLDRMSTIAAGDVSLVLADLHNVPRAELRRVVVEHDRSQRLLRFVLSPQYLELRARLGMGVR